MMGLIFYCIYIYMCVCVCVCIYLFTISSAIVYHFCGGDVEKYKLKIQ